MPARAAASPEILVNPSFESDIDGWKKHIKATLSIVDTDPQQGDYCCYATDKYNNNDGPFQDITEQINFYGKGKYNISAYMKLDTAESADAQLVVSTESDASVGAKGKLWFTGNIVKVNNKTWVKLDGVVDITWTGTLNFCEFYYVINPVDSGIQPHYLDNCSMTKVDYSGPAFTEPTEAPTSSPTIAPTPTLAPTASPAKASEAMQTTAPSPTPAPKGKNSAIPYAGFGVAVILIAFGVAVLLLEKKKKVPLVEDPDKTE